VSSKADFKNFKTFNSQITVEDEDFDIESMTDVEEKKHDK
jgi:hypothetical protein